MGPRAKLFLPLLLFGVLALFLFRGLSLDPQELPSALIDKPMPTFSLPALGGDRVLTRADVTGQASLFNVWATWCVSCRVEHPYLQQLADAGVPIYGINYKDDPAKALGFLEELGDPYTRLGADPNGRTALDWGLYGVPETYVIDGEGRIVLRFAGPITSDILSERIRPAIAEASRTSGLGEGG